MKTQSFVLVPAWLEKALAHANKSLADMFDHETLPSILSTDDLIFYATRQSDIIQKVAPTLGNDSRWVDFGAFYPRDYEKAPAFMRRIRDDQWTKETSLWSAMPLDANIPEASRENPKAYSFEIFEIKEGYMGVRLIPADPLQSPLKNEFDALHNALTILNSYYTIEELATLETFRRYVKVAAQLR